MAAAAIAAAQKHREKKLKEKRGSSEDEHNERSDEEILKDLAAEQEARDTNPFTSPDQYEGVQKLYLQYVTKPALALSQEGGVWEPHFSFVVILAIVVAGVLVGVSTYPTLECADWNVALDVVVTVIFIVEVFVKLAAEGMAPWKYWTGAEYAWNNFDFLIVIMCLPWGGDSCSGDDDGGDAADDGGGAASAAPVLRLLRLARLVKLIRKVPQLQMIVMGLVGGLRSIGYIVLLLFLIFYLFAIAGITLFRDNDPYHWHNVPTALMTLFRAATLEDWTDVMYIGIYGCERYPGGIYKDKPGENATDAADDERYMCEEKDDDDWVMSDPNGDVLVAMYWVLFITISALVMLSLFVGSVTMSMSESMNQMKDEQEEAARKARLLKQMRKQQSIADVENNTGGPVRMTKEMRAQMREEAEMREMLSDLVNFDEAKEKAYADAHHIEEGCIGFYMRLSERCEHLQNHPLFTNSVTVVIIVAGIVVGLQADHDDEDGNNLQPKETQQAYAALDYAITAVFIFEIMVKVVAEEFQPWHFFNSSWNTFDFFVVAAAFLPNVGDLVVILRLLRLLRVLKLIKSLPQLAVIVNALLMGLTSIGFISMILVLFFYLFAILGIMLFRDNDDFHFGTLFKAMLTLFRLATFEDWTDVMYINMYGCDKYGYTDDDWMVDMCAKNGGAHPMSWWAFAYFFTFVLLGGLVLLTLFIGVVTTSMEEATDKAKKEKETEDKIVAFAIKEKIDPDLVTNLKKVFMKLDLDGGGTIEEEELKVGLKAIGKELTQEQLTKIMSKVDDSGDGCIDMAEFIEFMILIKKSTIINSCLDAGKPIPAGWVEDERAVEFRTMAKEIGLITTVSKAKVKFMQSLTSRQLGNVNSMQSGGGLGSSSKGFGGKAENIMTAMEESVHDPALTSASSSEVKATSASAPAAAPSSHVSRTRSIKVAPSSSPQKAQGDPAASAPSTPADRMSSPIQAADDDQPGVEEEKSVYADTSSPTRNDGDSVTMTIVPAGVGDSDEVLTMSGKVLGPSPKRDLGQGMSEEDLEFDDDMHISVEGVPRGAGMTPAFRN